MNKIILVLIAAGAVVAQASELTEDDKECFRQANVVIKGLNAVSGQDCTQFHNDAQKKKAHPPSVLDKWELGPSEGASPEYVKCTDGKMDALLNTMKALNKCFGAMAPDDRQRRDQGHAFFAALP